MPSTYIARVFLVYLALTILIETVVLFALLRLGFGLDSRAVSNRFVLIAGVTASLATYPYLWFLAPVLIPEYLARHVVGEIVIILVESFILHGVLRISLPRAFLASLVCNGATILIGIPLNQWVIASGLVH